MNEYAYNHITGDYDPDGFQPLQPRRDTATPRSDSRYGRPSVNGNGGGRPDGGERMERGDRKDDTRRRQPQTKKKSASRPRRSWRESSVIKFFCDRRFHAVIGVGLIFVAVYIAVAAISFLKAGAEDESLVSSLTSRQIVDGGLEVANAAGPVGAHLAQSLIVQGLGISSVVLVVYLVLIGLSLLRLRVFGFWSVTFKSLLVAVTVSIVAGFVSLWLDFDFNLGGYHGRYINMALVSYIDWIGAALVSLLLLVSVFYVYINDILALYNRYKAVRNARRAQADQRRMQQAEDRERVKEAMENGGYMDDAGNVDDSGEKPKDVAPRDMYLEFNTPEPGENADDIYAIGSEPAEAVTDDQAERQDYNMTGREDVSSPVAATLAMPGLDVVSHVIEEAPEAPSASVYDPTAELSRYRMPGLDLLKDVAVKAHNVDREEQEENKERITKTLNDYGIAISHIQATVGPTVTLYEIIPAEGVRIAKIKRLEDDIAMSLAALGIRIIAPIPGKGTIGIEVPNKDPQTVSIRSILGSRKFQECKYALPMAMGATISNEVYIADLTKMPHLLVAGATGMGKSVGLNTIIASLLYKKHPAELKFVLIDPKMVEFSLYSVLERHYLAKLPDEEEAVVTSMDKVLATLNSLCVEMDQRYLLLRDANVRSITEYNERFIEKRLNPEKGHRYLPYIVMIVDEFADLIMTAGKDVEKPIARIAQKARAVGMHMIIATQRPSTNVITGIIKANFPGRIAFRVSQMVDSKTILDRTGANQLIGRGDMLFSHNGSLDRVQCAFIDTPEVQAICDHIDAQAGYEHAYFLPEPVIENDGAGGMGSIVDRDPLFEEAAEIVVSSGVASTSSLQRRYSIGYNRAGKIMDQLEAAGIVGPSQGGKPRQVLVDHLQLGAILHSL